MPLDNQRPAIVSSMPPGLNDFAHCVIACPLCKEPLNLASSGARKAACSTCGAVFGRDQNEVWDLRLSYPKEAAPKWRLEWDAMQDGFVAWEAAVPNDTAHFLSEIDCVRELYEDEFPLSGSVLDIGGHQGRLRHFLDDHDHYLSVDPFTNIFDQVVTHPSLLEAYPCVREPCNFVGGFAEWLPIASASFDYAHMRSVIDHLYDPFLALREAWRVLHPGGGLLIGTLIIPDVSTQSQIPLKTHIKTLLTTRRWSPPLDHHFWHPTHPSLIELVEDAGFSIEKEVWQKPPYTQCVYLMARKPNPA